jgi:hypothetical protein
MSLVVITDSVIFPAMQEVKSLIWYATPESCYAGPGIQVQRVVPTMLILSSLQIVLLRKMIPVSLQTNCSISFP